MYAQPAFRSISHHSNNGQANIHSSSVPGSLNQHHPSSSPLGQSQSSHAPLINPPINFGPISNPQVINTGSNNFNHNNRNHAAVFESLHSPNTITGCPHPPVPLYAQVTLSDEGTIRPGSTAAYKCDDGYELFGPSVRTCGHNGKWSDDVPYCGKFILLILLILLIRWRLLSVNSACVIFWRFWSEKNSS